jgi:23S rRNA pseudouridine1911/1915/1917 synthase
MVLAKTSKAASRLSRQFRERSVDKAYLALVLGRAPESGDLRDVLARDGRVSRRAEGGEPGTEARLSFRLASSGLVDGRPASLLEVDLLTGLRHQIRAQLSLAGHPIFGDELYGGPRRPAGAPSIGLWSTALALDHPVGGRRLAFREPPPDIWPFSRLRPKAGF